MKIKPSTLVLALSMMSIMSLGLADKAEAKLDKEVLQSRLEKIDQQASFGRLGVGVRDLATGDEFFLRGDQRFPMQSVFKLPLAMAVLDQVQNKHLYLKDKLKITADDLSIQHSPLAENFKGPEEFFTIAQLIEAAICQSDNTAADVLMKKIGKESVNKYLKAKGIDTAFLRVDRLESELQTDWLGLGTFKKEWARTEHLQAAILAVPAEKRVQAIKTYQDDERDTATPGAMVDLLAKFDRGEMLNHTYTDYLRTVLLNCKTGKNRLFKGLPRGSTLAHKTGTSGTYLGLCSATNDVGIATLPNGNKAAIAVFLSGAQATAKKREDIIEQVAQAVSLAMRN